MGGKRCCNRAIRTIVEHSRRAGKVLDRAEVGQVGAVLSRGFSMVPAYFANT